MWQFFIAIIQALTGQCILRCSPKVAECANRRFALVASTGFWGPKPKNYTPHSSLIGGNIILVISPDPFYIHTRQKGCIWKIETEKMNSFFAYLMMKWFFSKRSLSSQVYHPGASF